MLAGLKHHCNFEPGATAAFVKYDEKIPLERVKVETVSVRRD